MSRFGEHGEIQEVHFREEAVACAIASLNSSGFETRVIDATAGLVRVSGERWCSADAIADECDAVLGCLPAEDPDWYRFDADHLPSEAGDR